MANLLSTSVTGTITATGNVTAPTFVGALSGNATSANSAGSVSGLTLTSSANGINPDNVTQNQIGYNTNVSLFSQTDGGLYSSAYGSSWIHQIYGDFRTGQIAIRGKNSGTWQAWRSVLDSSNFSSWAAAASHTHAISDVTGLQTALDGKQASGSYAAASHTHAISDVTGLQGALDGKQAAGSYAASSHTHSIANITNLQSTLDAKLNGDSVALTSFYNTFQTYTSKYDDGSLRQTGAAGNANAGVGFMYFPTAANADSPATDSGPLILSMSPGAPSATYDAATRIQQLAFGQTQGLSYRISTSATAWTGWTRVMDTNNFSTWAVSKTYNTSLNSDSRNSRGVTRLYRYDSDSDFSLQHYWTGTYWHLRGFSGDTYHAGVQVAYADSAGSAPANGGQSDRVVISYNDNSNAAYQMLWGSGNNVYGTANIYCNPSTNIVYAAAFYDSDNTGYYLNPNGYSNLYTARAYEWQLHAGAGYGVRFWGGSSSYSIQMSEVGNTSWGGRVAGETTSDYNMYFTMTGGTNRGFVFRNSVSSSGVVAGIDASGNFRAVGDVIVYASSDARLKDNVKPIENALNKVMQIRGVEFDWNDSQDAHTGHDIGVIAQEVEAVLPEIVTTRDTGYKAVKYEKLTALLIETVKELKAEIDDLRAQLNSK